jgi:hypothetical protein
MAGRSRRNRRSDPTWATIWNPPETAQNRELAAMGADTQRPELRQALLLAIWPDHNECPCGQVGVTTAHGTEADIASRCPTCRSTLALAEHKPHAAKRQTCPATWEEYEAALEVALIQRNERWPGTPPESCCRPHTWSNECEPWFHARRPGSLYQLGLPQVVSYALHAGMPVTLITDRGSATEVYKTRRAGFDISPAWVPVRTHGRLINTLVSQVARAKPSAAEYSQLRHLVTILWAREPWRCHQTLNRPAKRALETWTRPHLKNDPERSVRVAP